MSSPRIWVALGVLVVFATGAVGAVASRQQAQAGPAYKVVGKWGGGEGTGNGQFRNNVFGLAVDKAGKVYAADSDNHRVQVFTSKGTFVRKIMVETSLEVQDVAIDPEGNTWATVLQAAQARQFSKSGAPLATVGTPKSALGIAVDATGNLYVSTGGRQHCGGRALRQDGDRLGRGQDVGYRLSGSLRCRGVP